MFSWLEKYRKIESLCKFFPEANAYRVNLDEVECMYFLMKEKNNIQKNIIKFGKRLAI